MFLGRKPERMRREPDGRLNCDLPPQLQLSMPVLFSAMSYGSISYNAHACLARAARELGICYNTGEGGLHEDFMTTVKTPSYRSPPDGSAYISGI